MTRNCIGWILAGSFLVGCAPTIPKELLNARSAYNQAASGPAARLAPNNLQAAHEALNRAEASFGESGASETTRALASEAERKVDEAQARCELAAGVRNPEVVTKTVTETVTVVEPRLISLPGQLLFAFDQATLLPGAQKQLEGAVDALRKAKAENKEIHVVVEGHTDSIGTREYNQKLSERRAAAVRNFLVARGQNPSLVTLRAKGQDEPFTSNATQEGRANNRRVDILIIKDK